MAAARVRHAASIQARQKSGLSSLAFVCFMLKSVSDHNLAHLRMCHKFGMPPAAMLVHGCLLLTTSAGVVCQHVKSVVNSDALLALR